MVPMFLVVGTLAVGGIVLLATAIVAISEKRHPDGNESVAKVDEPPVRMKSAKVFARPIAKRANFDEEPTTAIDASVRANPKPPTSPKNDPRDVLGGYDRETMEHPQVLLGGSKLAAGRDAHVKPPPNSVYVLPGIELAPIPLAIDGTVLGQYKRAVSNGDRKAADFMLSSGNVVLLKSSLEVALESKTGTTAFVRVREGRLLGKLLAVDSAQLDKLPFKPLP